MNNWVPIVAGYTIIAIAILIARFAPQSGAAHELRTWYGVAPSGKRGERTRRDQFLSSGIAAAIGIGLLLAALGISFVGDRYSNGSRANLAAATYAFGSLILGVMALVVAAVALSKGLVWRVELPDWPEHRIAFVDAMDRVIDGQSTPDEEAEVLQVRYQYGVIEQLRRNWLREIRKHGGSLPDPYRRQFKELTASIRASAS